MKNKASTKSVESKQYSFTQLLLIGPVMSKEQYKLFKQNRKALNAWRTTAYASLQSLNNAGV